MAMNIVAVAGLIGGMVGDAPIPVKLDGFDRFSGFQSSDGTFPVRWNKASYPWIEDVASCRSLWQSRSLVEEGEEGDWTGLRLSLSFEDKHPLFVKTCAEWAAGLESGRGAMSTWDMREPSHAQSRHGRTPFRRLTFMPSHVYCSPRPLIETPSVGQMARISSGTSRATAFTVKTRCPLNGSSPWCLGTSMAMGGKTWLLCMAVVQRRAPCEVMASVLSHG